MTYEALSRALAYASCLSSMTLFATSMAIAAINVGKLGPPGPCGSGVCTALAVQADDLHPGPMSAAHAATSGAHIQAVATTLWHKKI
ncbi:MAG TPA: hypothetical protein PKD49_01500 [Hyphomicrobium sp.]|nr:hypothetical protein [Hyphomicrobium sp.]